MPVILEPQILNRAAQSPSNYIRRLEISRLQKDDELVPPKSCHHVAGPKLLLYAARNRNQHVVPAKMSKGVIDPFEVVQIEEYR